MVRILRSFDRYGKGETATFRPEKEAELIRRGIAEKAKPKEKNPEEPQHRQTTVERK